LVKYLYNKLGFKESYKLHNGEKGTHTLITSLEIDPSGFCYFGFLLIYWDGKKI